MKEFNEEFLDRFWSKVFYSIDGCWYWIGALNHDGYGQLSIKREVFRAHRLSYSIHKGDLEGKQVLHSCDNPACVNPDHLRLGTQRDNMGDMALRNRSSHGERKRNAIFTDNLIRIIREAAAYGHRQRAIARYFRCHHKSINSIVNRTQWKRVV